MTFKLGELFCGPGGIAIGARDAGFVAHNTKYSIQHAWANDIDYDTCATFAKNICSGDHETVICEDVRTLDYSKLGPIDGLAFGFPCNDFSIVGEQLGINGEYGPLYTYGVKALKSFRPKWFLAENVSGLRKSNEGLAFQQIIQEFQDVGYEVVAHLYRFEQYEVPQARHRIIIVGIRNDIPVEFKVPIIPNARIVTSREAIENPPIQIDAYNNELTRQSLTVIERLRHIRPGENAFNATMPDELRLNVVGAKISQIYKRLHPEKPAYTVTGSGGGGTHIYHWAENRALTNRERARLQTFPDDFVFLGSKESVRKQIGMAVPPKGVQVIFNAILKSFARISYPHTNPNIEIRNKDLFGNMVAEEDLEYSELKP